MKKLTKVHRDRVRKHIMQLDFREMELRLLAQVSTQANTNYAEKHRDWNW